MIKSGRLFFNLISLLLGVGLAFFAKPISSYAVSVDPVSSTSTDPECYQEVYRNFEGSPSSPSPTFNQSHRYVCYPYQSSFDLSFGGSTYGISSCSGEVYVITTEGCYLLYAGSSNSYSCSCPRVSSRNVAGYPLGVVGVLRGSRHGSNYINGFSRGTLNCSFTITDVTTTDPELASLDVIKQDTSQILSILNSMSLSTVETLLNRIEQHTIDIMADTSSIDDTCHDIWLSMSDILDTLVAIKKSVSYTFPSTIDGNYQLAHCFYRSSFSANNDTYDLGYFSFDITDLSSNYEFVIRVPDSRKILFLSTYSDSTYTYPLSFKYSDNTSVPYRLDNSSSYSGFAQSRIYTFTDSVPVGSYVICTLFRNPNTTFSGRFALYDYVVGANDILNYLEEQWEATKPGSSDLDDHNSGTGDLISDVNVIDTSVYTDFDSAYTGTGINGFDWSVFGGMIVFSTIVNNFWGALSSEFSLYIVAILIIGCAAVLLSAVARITKKGD